MTSEQLAQFGFTIARPSEPLGDGWGRAGEISIAFSPEFASNRGFVFAQRRVDGRYLILNTSTTRQAVECARLALGDAIIQPRGWLALAERIDSQPAFTSGDAHRYWLDCLEAEFAIRHTFRTASASSPERSGLALGCSMAAEVRTQAERTFIDAIRGAGQSPVVMTFHLEGEPGWVGRLPLPSLAAANIDVAQLQRLAGRYDLNLVAGLGHAPLRADVSRLGPSL